MTTKPIQSIDLSQAASLTLSAGTASDYAVRSGHPAVAKELEKSPCASPSWPLRPLAARPGRAPTMKAPVVPNQLSLFAEPPRVSVAVRAFVPVAAASPPRAQAHRLVSRYHHRAALGRVFDPGRSG